jgi:uncharacterized C2H2 Zn-finger protein
MATTPPIPPAPTVPPSPQKTKKCIDCDTECGETEEKCPKCGLVFKEADEEMGVVEKTLKRLAKKRKATPPAPVVPPATPPKKKSIFSSLNRKK